MTNDHENNLLHEPTEAYCNKRLLFWQHADHAACDMCVGMGRIYALRAGDATRQLTSSQGNNIRP